MLIHSFNTVYNAIIKTNALLYMNVNFSYKRMIF
jgi:hypothetical protein